MSQTPFALALLDGPVIQGISLGHGHFLFGDRVLSLTRPGAPRMPNGIECKIAEPAPRAPVQAGNGYLTGDFGSVHLGPLWDPRPRPRYAVSTRSELPSWDLPALAGRGPGLTPLGDDVLTGYLAAGALFGGPDGACPSLAESLAARTTALSGTLLRLAARAQVPEAAHRLLEDGDPNPLLSWGATSGSGLLVGLGLSEVALDSYVVRSLDLTLSLDPPRCVRVEICKIAEIPAA